MNLNTLKTLLIIVPAFIVTAYGCGSGTAADQEFVSDDAAVESVRVVELEYREIPRRVSYPANLNAYREVHLVPASPGRIERIHVDIGANVSRGQLLVEMDRTQLQQARMQLESLEKDYRRLDTLRKTGSVPQQQYDQIKTQYDLAKSNVEFLEENTTLRAPFNGTVSGKYFENGEMFSAAPNTPAGKAAILSIVQTSRLKALVNISERYIPNIQTGMEVLLRSDVWPGEDFYSTVNRTYPTVDPATRTFTVELELTNPEGKLRPGMFTRAIIDLEKVDALVVPALAVLKLQGSNERFVFIEEDGRARRVVVEIGDRFDDMIELVSDQIREGDRLIVAGQARLLDGSLVQVTR